MLDWPSNLHEAPPVDASTVITLHCLSKLSLKFRGLSSQLSLNQALNLLLKRCATWSINSAKSSDLVANAHLFINVTNYSQCSLLGTNVHEAQRILNESGLPITSANDLEDAAKKAVASVAKK